MIGDEEVRRMTSKTLGMRELEAYGFKRIENDDHCIEHWKNIDSYHVIIEKIIDVHGATVYSRFGGAVAIDSILAHAIWMRLDELDAEVKQ